MKWDLRRLTLAADNALERLHSAHHRAIAANYRLHGMLEVSARWPEIFAPQLMVERPFYRVAGAGPEGLLELDGAEAVQGFYKAAVAGGTTVMILEQETLVIADWGLASEALYRTFITGQTALQNGHPGADPAKKYVESRWVCMMWAYDEHARLIGERIYPASAATLDECAEADFLTVADAQRVFAPLIAEAQKALGCLPEPA